MLRAYRSRILCEGQGENLELLLSTQFPKDYASIVRSSVTEWGLFNTVERDELDAVRPYFPRRGPRGGLATGGIPRGESPPRRGAGRAGVLGKFQLRRGLVPAAVGGEVSGVRGEDFQARKFLTNGYNRGVGEVGFRVAVQHAPHGFPILWKAGRYD
jgi:hypothetical protein